MSLVPRPLLSYLLGSWERGYSMSTVVVTMTVRTCNME